MATAKSMSAHNTYIARGYDLICNLLQDEHQPITIQQSQNGIIMDFRIAALSQKILPGIDGYLLSNLSAEAEIHPGGALDNRRLFAPLQVTPSIITLRGTGKEIIYFRYHMPYSDLIQIERLRTDSAPLFILKLDGISEILIRSEAVKLRTEPMQFQAGAYVKVGVDTWVSQLKNASILDYRIMQIPVSLTDEITNDMRRSIDTAMSQFYNGGTLGYHGVLVHVRIAMEKAEALFSIPEFANISHSKDADRLNRIYANWYSLKRLTHLAAHETDSWSRDEAQYILTSFLSLLHMFVNVNKGSNAP